MITQLPFRRQNTSADYGHNYSMARTESKYNLSLEPVLLGMPDISLSHVEHTE